MGHSWLRRDERLRGRTLAMKAMLHTMAISMGTQLMIVHKKWWIVGGVEAQLAVGHMGHSTQAQRRWGSRPRRHNLHDMTYGALKLCCHSSNS